MKAPLLCFVLTFFTVPLGRAQTVSLPFVVPVFTDHMVVQRDQADPIWGWAKPGETITVTMGGQSARAVAGGDGKWIVRLMPPPVGGPYALTVAGSRTVTFKDVLVGDVWLCVGQSNMEFGLQKVPNAAAEIAGSNHPNIRLLTVNRVTALHPLDVPSVKDAWAPCTVESVAAQGTWEGFSAVGYFFGRDLQQDLKIPVGLIQVAWGGTPAASWMSREALQQVGSDFRPELGALWQVEQLLRAGTYDRGKLLESWYSENGVSADVSTPGFDASSWKTMKRLPHFWGGGDDPSLADFQGAVWFRKEIDLPATAAGRDAVLHLGVLDDGDVTWVNGVRVGTEMNLSRRDYKIRAGLLKPGRNIIATWLVNTIGAGGMTGKADDYALAVSGLAPISLAGDWRYNVLRPLDRMTPRLFAVKDSNNWPTLLFNGMVSPLAPYAIKGVVWYQGEEDVGAAAQYRKLLPALFADWRSCWQQGDFPFLIVQLAGFGGDPAVAELREAQAFATQTVPGTGLVTAVDIGDPHNLHPANKHEVGRRLAVLARGEVYHEPIVFSGPTYQASKADGSTLRITFDHVAKGFEVLNSNDIKGFVLAGSDRIFYPADARIEGNEVVLTSSQVAKPVAARYDWAASPDGNLYNDAELPVFPFRTDDWSGPMILKK